jgi:hypothetical protein
MFQGESGDAASVGGIGSVEVPDLQLLHPLRDAVTKAGNDVVDQPLLGIRGHPSPSGGQSGRARLVEHQRFSTEIVIS